MIQIKFLFFSLGFKNIVSKIFVKNTLGLLVFDKLFSKIFFFYLTYPVSAFKSLPVAGNTLHTAHCTVYTTHCTCTWTCTCTLHTTHLTLQTAHIAFILLFANLSLHTANIQNFPELYSRYTWQNVS